MALNDLPPREELEPLGALVVADDLANRPLVALRPSDNLIQALEFFGDGDFDKLSIVEDDDVRGKLMGYVRYRDIIAFY